MEIENLKAARRAKLWLIRIPLLLVLVILVLTLMDIIPSFIWLIISAGIFLITLLSVLVGRMQYVKISSDSSEILIRHYHLFPLISDYQELLIQRSDNPEFELKNTFLNMIPVLHITIHTRQGNAFYPPIPLGLISKNDLKKLTDDLGL
jgi:hypothetical protein